MYRNNNSNSVVHKGKKLFVWMLLLTVMAAIVVADVDKAAGAPAGRAGPADVSAVQTIRFDEGATVRDALRVLSARYQKNIVPSGNVDGALGFTRLFDVTFAEAMTAIMGSALKYEQEGQLIRVYTKEEFKKIKADPDRMEYKVITLYYITAEEARKLISPVISGSAGARVEVSTPAETDISGGEQGGAESSGSLGSGGGGDSLATHDTVVIYDFPENIEKAERVVRALDVRPKQVLVEATILSALLTEGMDLGVDLNFMAGIALDGTAATDDITTATQISRGTTATSPIADIKDGAIVSGSPMETFGFAVQGGRGLRIGISTGEVRAFITALETVTDTTVLANPKILAVNKQEGAVLIGTRLGYRSSTTISTAGVAAEGEVKFLQTGTQLVFRPYIGNDDFIRMDIYPKDSSASLNSDGVPTENTTQLQTNIVVKDGETIVIGGLFRDVVTTTRQQVPLLGDLPLVGALFRGTTDSTQREEVIILLTPHIIDGADQTDGEARVADIARKRYGARMAVQGISRAKLAEDHYVNAVKYYADGNNVEALCELDKALDMRPSYLEALRLKERIIGEVSPDDVGQIERIMLGVIEREESLLWNRR
jgi:type IV pilus assembly protein PilQ